MKKELQDALNILWRSVAPELVGKELIYNGNDKTEEEIKVLKENITAVAYYSDYVKRSAENGDRVMSFDDWILNNN